MCLILMAWQQHPQFPLVMLANRDEFYERPSQIPRYWIDHPDIYGGRDLVAEGTWLAVNRLGRLAAVTNYRDPSRLRSDALSRGQLTAGFLSSDDSLEEYVNQVKETCEKYNDFNLILCDLQTLTCFESKQKNTIQLSPGIYGLSNHSLDTPWPKLVSTKKAFSQTLSQLIPKYDQLETLMEDGSLLDELTHILADETIYPDNTLPSTGVSLDVERRISAAFIKSSDYGTRATTLVIANNTGDFLFYEKQFGVNGIFEGDTCRLITRNTV